MLHPIIFWTIMLLELILHVAIPIAFIVLVIRMVLRRRNARIAENTYYEAMQELDDLEEDLKNHKET